MNSAELEAKNELPLSGDTLKVLGPRASDLQPDPNSSAVVFFAPS